MDIKCKLYNYADDNTISYCNNDISMTKHALENDCTLLNEWFCKNMMKANPEKFQVIFIGKHIQSSEHYITIEEHKIYGSSSVNVLVIELDQDLNFNDHIMNICSKSARQMNALSRIRSQLDIRSRLCVYNSYIVSNFNYCITVWMFTNKKNMAKLDKVNERAVRLIYNDKTSDYDDLLCAGNLFDIYKHCAYILSIETFKIRHQLSPMYLCTMLEQSVSRYNLRDQSTYVTPRFKSKLYGYHSFRYLACKFWNLLDYNVKNTETLLEFKSKVKNWLQSKSTLYIKSELF